MGHKKTFLILWILISFSKTCLSWQWIPFFGNTQYKEKPPESWAFDGDVGAEFSLEALDDGRGIQLVENARRKLANSNSCWQNAYQQIFSACSEIIGDESEKRKRFAWDLSNCFQQDSGRSVFPHCHTNSNMKKCLGNLDNNSHQTYLQFFLETNTICYQLQSSAFRRQTQRLVNDLKNSAHNTKEKLDNLVEKSDHLLQSSNKILHSLASINQHTQQVAETSKNVSDHLFVVAENSGAVLERTREITASQSELQKEQEKMKNNLEQGMATIHESYNNLGQKIDDIKDETAKVEKEMNKVGNAMTNQMNNLQSKANDIGNMTQISSDKQKQLLDKQSRALEGLQSLTDFQSKAQMESRAILKELAEFGHKQQEMLLQRQQQLEQAHINLVENSKSILAAQETFGANQANMFFALDKLFTLLNSMLVESRLIKAFFVYCLWIFILYMLTSTKQTCIVRPMLYIGLCAAFMIEFTIVRFMTNDIEQQTKFINVVRLFYVLLASVQLLYAIFTYRDYELLNHQMLLTLIEMVNSKRQRTELSWDSDSDSEVELSLWVDTEIPDDVDNLNDPDYMFPEDIGENSIFTSAITRRYDLRRRPR